MKTKYKRLYTIASLSLSLLPAVAQTTAPQSSAYCGSATEKLFGNNLSYSATKELQTDKKKPVLTQIFFDEGKSRHEMDLASLLPSSLGAQKDLKYILLFLPDKNQFYQIHPEVQGYFIMPFPKTTNSQSASDYQLEATELAKETIEGHACTKNKTVVTDPQGREHEYTVWNAADLNNFPVKIQTTNNFHEVETTIYRSVKLTKPNPKLFELPAGYKQYSDIGALMRAVMMKQMPSMGGM